MFSRNFSKLLKYGVVGSIGLGTAVSLRSNNYEWNSIGIVRLSRAAITVLKISINYKKNLYGLNLDMNSPEFLERKSICHTQAAEKLLNLCCTNKGVYIKIGQHIASLDYLLPNEYVKVLRVLHKDAPRNTLEDIYKVLREDMKREPSEIFKVIEPEPLGTASLAQVHKAVLHDGRVVAVKVQHPYVQGNSLVDMKTMEVLVNVVSRVFPDFNFKWLVDESKRNLPKELDFTQEGENGEKLAAMFSRYEWLKVPKIHWDLTTTRVLTMDFVEGGQVNDIQYIHNNKINPYEVSDKLGKLYSQMIFINGFVHSDPHPGNILVKKTPNGTCDIILLDHGLYGNLSKEFRFEYAQLWLSILNVDRPAMRYHCNKLGVEGDLYPLFACMVTGRTWGTILSGIDVTKPSKSEKEEMQTEFPNYLPKISDILQTVNSQMLLILKTNDLLRGIEYALGTQQRMSAFKVMSTCCVRSVYGEFVNHATNRLDKIKYTIQQYWLLLKISVYYALLKYNFMNFIYR